MCGQLPGRTGRSCSAWCGSWSVRPVSGRSSISVPAFPWQRAEVAQQIMAEVRVAYLDNDPIVHVHACALLTGDDNTSIVLTDLREPEAILACPRVRELIDFSQPFAVLLIAIVHFLTGDEDVGRIIATLSDALVPGSYLALSHGAGDFHRSEER